MSKAKVFMRLLDEVLAAKTDEELDEVCGKICRAYQHEEAITSEQEQMLYKVINALQRGMSYEK